MVSDTVSSELVLKKNPHYWSPGEPYLDNLTFKSVASDEAALETMQAGGVDGYEGMQTPQLVSAFGKQFNVLDVPSTSPYVIQLNTGIAPTAAGLQKRLGFLAGDSAGYPNGRRPIDDVFDISLRAVGGVLADGKKYSTPLGDGQLQVIKGSTPR